MKFLFAAFCAFESVLALQNGYLSQLNGARNLAAGNPSAPHAAFVPTSQHEPPQQRQYDDEWTTNGSAGAAFFPSPAVSMADLYSSAPPGAGSHNMQSGAGKNGGMASYAPTRNYRPSSSTTPTSTTSNDLATVPSTELLTLWSNQVSVELSASQLYLSASIWFRSRGYAGMAAWMLDESGEERGHGLAILEFAMKKNFPVVLQPLQAPRHDWNTPTEVWQDILQAEQTNTQNLLRLAQAAQRCGDFGAMAFLDAFHVEQLEAEDTVGAILRKVQYNSPELMAQLDYDLGKKAEEEEEHGH